MERRKKIKQCSERILPSPLFLAIDSDWKTKSVSTWARKIFQKVKMAPFTPYFRCNHLLHPYEGVPLKSFQYRPSRGRTPPNELLLAASVYFDKLPRFWPLSI